MYVSLFFLGLAGSLHCMGMCGPLNLIAPINRTTLFSMLKGMATYHIGRISVYILLGALIGSIGQLFSISKIQSYLSIFFGILLVLWGASYYLKNLQQWWTSRFDVNRYFIKYYNRFLSKNSTANVFSLGALNGILPCGLVYSAMAMAFLNASVFIGALNMASFGLGTLPLLFIFQFGAGNGRFYSFLKKQGLTPILFILSGLFVIYKAYSLMVPREANLWNAIVDPIMCH